MRRQTAPFGGAFRLGAAGSQIGNCADRGRPGRRCGVPIRVCCYPRKAVADLYRGLRRAKRRGRCSRRRLHSHMAPRCVMVPGRASPIFWLAKIARNRAIDWRRAHPPARYITLDDAPDLIDGALDAETLLIRVETHDYLAFSLSALDACARNLIQSAFFDGITYAELAHRNAMPLGTVKSQIRRRLAKMRVVFDT